MNWTNSSVRGVNCKLFLQISLNSSGSILNPRRRSGPKRFLIDNQVYLYSRETVR